MLHRVLDQLGRPGGWSPWGVLSTSLPQEHSRERSLLVSPQHLGHLRQDGILRATLVTDPSGMVRRGGEVTTQNARQVAMTILRDRFVAVENRGGEGGRMGGWWWGGGLSLPPKMFLRQSLLMGFLDRNHN